MFKRKEEVLAEGFVRHKRLFWAFGLVSLIPIISLTLTLLFFDSQNALSRPLANLLITWAIIVLSFLGGIRFGHALIDENDEASRTDSTSLWISIIPPIVAWMVLLIDNFRIGIPVLIVAFCAQGAWDSISSHTEKLPGWVGFPRMVFTGIVSACLLIAFFKMY